MANDRVVARALDSNSPLGYDVEQYGRLYPGLVPPVQVGRPLSFMYTRSALATRSWRDASADASNVVLRLAGQPLVLMPALGAGVLLLCGCVWLQQRWRKAHLPHAQQRVGYGKAV
jgi:hypothetical protein